jgi:hydroxypyruvate isomerase
MNPATRATETLPMTEPLEGTDVRWTRRGILRTAAALSTTGAIGGLAAPAQGEEPGRVATKGRLQQSVCRWCYGKIPLEELCSAAKRMGLVGIDLLTARDFPTVKQHGLVCTMTTSHPLSNGLCDPKYQEPALKAINEAIEATAREGWKNVICFSGNRRGIDDETGMKNCVKALREVVPVAEKAGVTLHMELLNSKVDHKDYMCDRSPWGIELVKRVGSDRFKLLYDIYHMQIMEGDVIRTIERDQKYFGHYHTGGNPGRHELDDTQELNYKPIARALAGLGFAGYFAHEFIPTRDPLTSLSEAVALCDV